MQSNRWYKISYFYLVPSCEYLDAERISGRICWLYDGSELDTNPINF